MPVALENTRLEWEQGYRRLQAEADRKQRERLLAQVEVVTDQLRRRVGQTFTLAQLADAYADADSWSREAVEEHAATPGWPQNLTTVEDAAFHLYSRGAVDFEP